MRVSQLSSQKIVRTEMEDSSSVPIIHHLRLCNLIKRGFVLFRYIAHVNMDESNLTERSY